jgi:hypothetical protein
MKNRKKKSHRKFNTPLGVVLSLLLILCQLSSPILAAEMEVGTENFVKEEIQIQDFDEKVSGGQKDVSELEDTSKYEPENISDVAEVVEEDNSSAVDYPEEICSDESEVQNKYIIFSEESAATEEKVDSLSDYLNEDCSAINQTVVYVNPFYEEVIQKSDLNVVTAASDDDISEDVIEELDLEPDLVASATDDDITNTEETVYYSDIESAAEQMRQMLKNRVETFDINYYYYFTEDTVSYKDLANEIGKEALWHTGVSNEGDYLQYTFAGWMCSISARYEQDASRWNINFEYTITYYTTLEQEEEVNAAVTSIISSLNLEDADTYEKIQKIYDYICKNVTYDYDNLENDEDFLKYTAYAALTRKKAVCQGYSNLLYRLLLEAGIDNRIITGTANGGAHSWNIVKIGNYYYNLDATWDAECYSVLGYYSYFLKSNENFSDHERSLDFTTDYFNESYPMGSDDYDKGDEDLPYEEINSEYGTILASGSCGTHVTWQLNTEGTMYISGYGDMSASEPGELPWQEYKDKIQSVIFESGVTSVGDSAFYWLDQESSITNVTFSETITSIGNFAFVGNAELQNFTLPEGLLSIGQEAFCRCTSLTEIVIPDSVTFLDAGIFSADTALTSAYIGKSIRGIGDGIFTGCTSLTEINNSLENPFFYSEDGVWFCHESETESSLLQYPAGKKEKSYIVPDGVIQIFSYAFAEVQNLEEVYITEGVTEIGPSSFSNCNSLNKVILPNSLQNIGESAFIWCTNLKEITLPYDLKEIELRAFAQTGLTEVIIPGTVTEIYPVAFGYCYDLKTVIIEEGVTTIGEHVFEDCKSLTRVTIPKSVTTISADAFECSMFEVEYDPIENIEIVGSADSEAERYAELYGYKFINADSLCEASGHSWSDNYVILLKPTCTDAGLMTNTCSVCGSSREIEIEALGQEHDYEVVITEPDCYEGGYTTYTCTRCGDTFTEDETEALDHDYEAVITEPDCYEGGYTTYTCTRCGDTYTEDETEALEHDYEVVITEPDCYEGGYTTYTCTHCGDTYTEDETEALGHDYNAVVTEPTCTEEGYTTYTCTRCGDTIIEDETEALGHDCEAVVTEPTCTTKGYITYVCDICSYSYIGSEIDTIAHTLVTDAAVAPTCTETGRTEGSHCSVCGDTIVAQKTVEALGHTKVTDKAVAATCTKSGLTAGTHCSVCNEVLTAQKTVAALGHKYTSKVTKPTYTANGYTTYTCSRCGNSYKSNYTNMLTLTKPTVKVANTSTGVKVTWSKTTGATGYIVYRKTAKGTFTAIKTITSGSTVSYVDTTAKAGTTYYYTVRAYAGSNKSNKSSYVTDVSIKYLAQPTVKLANASNGVKVTWSKTTGASGYYVYRKIGTEKWVSIATIKSGSTVSYTDTTAKAGTTYYYTVKAYSGKTYSSYVTDKTIKRLTQPVVTLSNVTKGVKISWKKITGASGYIVYRRTASNKWSPLKTLTSASTLSYTDTTGKNGTTYYYTVKAYSGNINSSYVTNKSIKYKK